MKFMKFIEILYPKNTTVVGHTATPCFRDSVITTLSVTSRFASWFVQVGILLTSVVCPPAYSSAADADYGVCKVQQRGGVGSSAPAATKTTTSCELQKAVAKGFFWCVISLFQAFRPFIFAGCTAGSYISIYIFINEHKHKAPAAAGLVAPFYLLIYLNLNSDSFIFVLYIWYLVFT